MTPRLLCAFAFLLALLPANAHAWWNGDWAYRKKIFLDTQALSGAGASEAVTEVAVPVRLHTGNFLFADMKADGADLRFLAADDKTPLKHHVEKLDTASELAIIWVQVPKVTLGQTGEHFYMYYGNPQAVTVEDSAGTYGRSQTLVMHFNDRDGVPRDATAYGNHSARTSATPGVAGVIDTGAGFNQGAAIAVPASPSTRLTPGRGFTFSAWLKIDAEQDDAAVFSQQEAGRGIQIGVNQTALFARVTLGDRPAEIAAAGQLTPGQWHHVAVTLTDQLSVYIDGKPVATAPSYVPELGGDIVLGTPPGAKGLAGALDEVQLANLARPADWIALAGAIQRPETNVVAFGEDEETGGGSTYFEIYKVLANAVTLDGWIIIGVIVLLGLTAADVIVTKSFALSRTEKNNGIFVRAFRKREAEMLAPARGLHSAGAAAVDPSASSEAKLWQRHSSLYRVYHAGLEQVRSLLEQERADGRPARLDAESLAVVRSTLDSTMIEEAHALNRRLVLLTITISGAPFFGLLGTVVGIMMTFGAIAAVGDVNVNTIAPGVAAALSTTVTGLLVAIPVMFAYNHIASKVRELTTGMEVFANELMGKFARAFGKE